jgi:D-tyrosyl-tRNA(Tyr) deacylase
MIALIQRVTRAEVRIGERLLGAIERGIVALIAVRASDGPADAKRLAERVLGYRIFPDAAQRMNLDLAAAAGDLLLVPQFTLAADTSRGMRPGFSTAAPPEQARVLFEHLVQCASERHPRVARGEFGAHMQVSLINDGPVTFWLET